MKRMFRILEFLSLAIFGCILLFFPHVAAEGIKKGLETCASAVLPALFPFFVLSNYWITSGFADRLSRLFSPLMRTLFHLPGSAASILVLGCICGYPLGAKTVAQLYRCRQLTKAEAEQTQYFCNNAGPTFIMGVLGAGVFQSTFIGIELYIIHLFSAFCVGIILRHPDKPELHSAHTAAMSGADLSERFTKAITDAGRTLFLVCVYVLFFAVLGQCLYLLMPDGLPGTVASGILELAGGASALAASSAGSTSKFIIAAVWLGFGGVCVMFQSVSILQSAGLSPKKLLIGKSLQAVFSGIIALALSPFLPVSHPCGGLSSFPHMPIFQQIALLLLVILFCVIFLKESSGKTEKNRI